MEADDATDGAAEGGLSEGAVAVVRPEAGWLPLLLLMPPSSEIPSPDPAACGWSRRAWRRLLRSSRAEARARAAADDDPPRRASEGVADESEAAAAAAAAEAALVDANEVPCFVRSVAAALALVPSVGLEDVEDGVALLVVPDAAMGGV